MQEDVEGTAGNTLLRLGVVHTQWEPVGPRYCNSQIAVDLLLQCILLGNFHISKPASSNHGGNIKQDYDAHHNCENVHYITTKEGWEAKLSDASRESKIIVANFSATWCKPCKDIAVMYCELANKYSSIVFLSVDVDELAELSSSWDINATPTFFFLKDGRQVDKLVGANKAELQKKTAAIADLAIKLRS